MLNEWDIEISQEVLERGRVIYRSRSISEGVFSESEIYLVWEREDASTLVYQVGQGHAGYQDVEMFVREDGQAIWVVGTLNNAQPRTIASLSFDTGEFHGDGDFGELRSNAWSTIHEVEGRLVQTQLTWSQDKKSGNQHLFDHAQAVIWQLSDHGWMIISGELSSQAFPVPEMPYRMAPPAWLPP